MGKGSDAADAKAVVGVETADAGHGPDAVATTSKIFTVTHVKEVTVDKRTHSIFVKEYWQDELHIQRFFLIHAEPTRLETWQVLPNGQRIAGFKEAAGLRLIIWFLTHEAEIEKEVKDMDESQSNFYF